MNIKRYEIVIGAEVVVSENPGGEWVRFAEVMHLQQLSRISRGLKRLLRDIEDMGNDNHEQ